MRLVTVGGTVCFVISVSSGYRIRSLSVRFGKVTVECVFGYFGTKADLIRLRILCLPLSPDMKVNCYLVCFCE